MACIRTKVNPYLFNIYDQKLPYNFSQFNLWLKCLKHMSRDKMSFFLLLVIYQKLQKFMKPICRVVATAVAAVAHIHILNAGHLSIDIAKANNWYFFVLPFYPSVRLLHWSLSVKVNVSSQSFPNDVQRVLNATFTMNALQFKHINKLSMCLCA